MYCSVDLPQEDETFLSAKIWDFFLKRNHVEHFNSNFLEAVFQKEVVPLHYRTELKLILAILR